MIVASYPLIKSRVFEVSMLSRSFSTHTNLLPSFQRMKENIRGVLLALICGGLAGIFSSCQNADKQAARHKFRDDLAAIKVCAVKGATFDEFRQQRIRTESLFESNKQYLVDFAEEFSRLSLLMSATEHCWTRHVRYPNIPLNPKIETENLQAMRVIAPLITNKLDETWTEQMKDPDFSPITYVHLGLKLIAAHSDRMLDALR